MAERMAFPCHLGMRRHLRSSAAIVRRWAQCTGRTQIDFLRVAVGFECFGDTCG